MIQHRADRVGAFHCTDRVGAFHHDELRRLGVALVAALLLVAASAPVDAGTTPLYRPIRRLSVAENGGNFGWALGTVGTRLIVGAPNLGPGHTDAHAYVFDPATGDQLHDLVVDAGDQAWTKFGVGAAGANPFVGIAGAGGPAVGGSVTVFDGETGGILQTFCCSGAVALGVGDDVLIGGVGGAGLFNPLTGNLVRTFTMPDPNNAGVQTMVQAGHTIAIAAEQPVGVYLFDDRTGTRFGLVGTRHGDARHFGSAMAVSGQTIAISEIPQVNVFDLGFGFFLGTINPPPALGNASFGRALAWAAGFLAVGAPSGGDKGAVHVHDASGNVVQSLPADGAGPQFGRALAALGASIAVGAPTDDGGEVIIYSPCGDGAVDAPVEQCDDANTVDDDACSNECRVVVPTTDVCGDADGDGAMSVTDGVQILRAAAGLSTVCTVARCDVDGSGAMSVTDAVRVLRGAAGLPFTGTCS